MKLPMRVPSGRDGRLGPVQAFVYNLPLRKTNKKESMRYTKAERAHHKKRGETMTGEWWDNEYYRNGRGCYRKKRREM